VADSRLPHDHLLDEQVAYYRARAPEYDEWWERRGRFDRGPELNAVWSAEVAELEAEIDAMGPFGDTLELACGTGIWTRRLRSRAESLTAVDASGEMIGINRARIGDPSIEYVTADLFAWSPPRRFDSVFFAFWLSHVPPERFAPFWDLVGRALVPGGRAVFIDNRWIESATSLGGRLGDRDSTSVERRLNDGRWYRIIKVFYDPDELEERLGELGWQAHVAGTAQYFIYGEASPP
jgi:demethylmenaquinone methyltransferase/2-methoxy-6-polyprenyl-1,4-benzoquinol methylase